MSIQHLAFRLLAVALLTALGTVTTSSAQSAPDMPGMLINSVAAEQQVIEGREALLTFRLDDAEHTFRRLFDAGGNEVPAYYHLTAIAFVRAMFRQDEPAYNLFFARSDSLYDLLQATPESAWQQFFRGDLFLMRAFVRARRGDFLRAAVSARAAYEGYIETLHLDPTLIDAERGVGVLKTFIGATPQAYRRFLRMFGYSGSIEEGVRLLEHAAQKGRYGRDEAELFLAVTRVFLDVRRKVGLETLSQRFESSGDPVTGLVYTFALRLARNPEKAIEVARRAIATMESPGYTPVEFLYYQLADAYFALNRFDEAATAYQRYIETFDGQSYQASSRLQLGLCLEMLGRRQEAQRWYAQVEAPTEFDIDQAARREARERRRHPLSESEKTLIRGDNAISAGHYDDAIKILEPVFYSKSDAQGNRTHAAYLIGRAHHLLRQWGEAATKYVYVRTHPVSKDLRWAPWATYYLGHVRVHEGKPDEARALFEEAIDFKGKYDYRKSLQRNARLALERLESGSDD